MADYSSNYLLPLDLIARIDEMAQQVGAGGIYQHTNMGSYSGFDTNLGQTVIDMAQALSVDDISQVDDDSFFVSFQPVSVGEDIMSFRLGHAYVYMTNDSRCYDLSREIHEIDFGDAIILACALKMSQRDQLLLIRYNDIAMMSNKAFTSRVRYDQTWNIYGGVLLESRSAVFQIDAAGVSFASMPFYKFRNMNECPEYSQAEVERRIECAEYVEITDKMDGSFIQMAYSDFDLGYGTGNVLVSTSGSINPEGNEQLSGALDYIQQHPEQQFCALAEDNPDLTFIYEFINPEIDPHVVRYSPDRWGIYLLGARDISSGLLWRHDDLEAIASGYGIKMTEYFRDLDLATVVDICHQASFAEREGFVVNIDGWLVKIKLDDFTGFSKVLKGEGSFNTLIANIARNGVDDLLAKIPMDYHDVIMGQAERLIRFDEEYKEIIETVADADGAPFYDGENDDDIFMYCSAALPVDMVKKCVSYIKTGKHPQSYLYKSYNANNPDASSLYKENELDEISPILFEREGHDTSWMIEMAEGAREAVEKALEQMESFAEEASPMYNQEELQANIEDLRMQSRLLEMLARGYEMRSMFSEDAMR